MNSANKPAWLCALLLAIPGLAQAEGSLSTLVGWVHVQTNDSSKPLKTEMKLLGSNQQFDSPGTAASVGNADTLLIAAVYAFNDHLSLKLEGGIPPRFDIYGSGTVAPPVGLGVISVDLGAHRPLAKATQWSPAAILQYSFRDAEAKLRPYLGLGAAYFWYTDVEVNPATRDELNNRFGRVLAVANLAPGDTTVKASASSSLAPLFNVGITYAFDEHWGMAASYSYVLLDTKSAIDIRAADGTRLAHSTTKIQLDPSAVALLLSYKF